MRWLESENDMGPPVTLANTLCWSVGIGVYFMSNSGWVTNVCAGIVAGGFVLILTNFIASWRIPVDARHSADKAFAAFKKLYPDCTVYSIALRKIEADRYVYSIRYDGPGNMRSKPQARRYLAVSRGSVPHVDELDRSDWLPLGLK